ncbi:MAG: RnfABCDGE type electron transport complex subunit D [Chitinispirillales bacterium]|jgi:electron transport complex protein RnfD|nr:RnfABCDGE type electron transport complex subunit D [Chitinispirillales bacterium]
MITLNTLTDSEKPAITAQTAAAKEVNLPPLHMSSSPHVRSAITVPMIMLFAIIAMVPSLAASVVFFGVNALILTAACVGAAVGTEWIINKALKKEQSIGDLSAVVTGILVAFNLPPSLPVWMAVIGSVFAIGVAKMVFGGLGANFINPALAGRAFLMANYPAEMTNFPATVFGSINALPDGISSATPLEAIKTAFSQGSFQVSEFANALPQLFFGNVGGTIGETSALALLIGGIFLIAGRIIDFRIPLTYIGTVFFLFWIANGTGTYFTLESIITPVFHVLAGGLMLGAFFMATDMATSPITPKGRIIFGIGCGVLTFLIRKYGGYPEGVSYSILLMNLVVPLIDRCTRPTIYGEVRGRG